MFNELLDRQISLGIVTLLATRHAVVWRVSNAGIFPVNSIMLIGITGCSPNKSGFCAAVITTLRSYLLKLLIRKFPSLPSFSGCLSVSIQKCSER
jgi:hypothetical protein